MHSQGVFAERVAVPRRSLVPVPAGLTPERAVLAEPLACCVGALRPHTASRLVVVGCGAIGLLTVYLAARDGAEVVAADPLAARRHHAERLGAARTVSSVDEFEPAWADVAVDAAGFEATWRGAVRAVRNGGVAVVVGLGQA